jgi:murein DD-endopeptidase MepM/ murein hydrolase activator NlpD
MRFRPLVPALVVALAVAAALGPPAAATPGEGGGAVAAPNGDDDGGGGGAAYGEPVPEQPQSGRRRAKRAKRVRRTASDPAGHSFPIAGPFGWGGPDARFGARRRGHRHQGQDLTAPLGTPVVAPRGGVIEAVGYQARGAGHYVVLDGEGEDYDYAFMHLRRGSIAVAQGAAVAAGQHLGEVGSTGRSTGPHLHFEIWVGGWFAGGHPIDPLPLLLEWSGA